MSINGSLNWLATNTRPDLAPIVSFLASYNRYPSKEHLKAALYTLRYVNSTHEYGISFHSKSPAAIQSFVHHPFDHDVEAYSDARPPQAHEFHELTSFCDACWGSQLGTVTPSPKVPKSIYSSFAPWQGTLSSAPVVRSCGNHSASTVPVSACSKPRLRPQTSVQRTPSLFASDVAISV